jgi:hypothetical protein
MRTVTPLRRVARRSAGLFVVLVLMTVPAAVLASHQFPDVITGSPFHSDIDAIADAGITAGFGDGGYHPADTVTRQAMAAFMHRGFGRVATAVGTATLSAAVAVDAGVASSAPVPVRVLTITVPGATNAFAPTQLVHVEGRVAFSADMNTSVTGCPCAFAALIQDSTTGTQGYTHLQTFENSTIGQDWPFEFDLDYVLVASPGPHMFFLYAYLSKRSGTDKDAVFPLTNLTSLTATTFPFGSTGTDEL